MLQLAVAAEHPFVTSNRVTSDHLSHCNVQGRLPLLHMILYLVCWV